MERIRETISSLNRRSILRASMVSLLILLTYVSTAASQPEDPIPVLDFGESQKAIAVTLHFSGSTTATLGSVEVFFGRAHGRAGDPPLLGVQLLDLSTNVIGSFNAWNPRWTFVETPEGRDSLVVLPEATGDIILPFLPNAAALTVKDLDSQIEVISVDLVPHLHNFCRDNRNDPDCGNVVNRPPNCNANGPYTAECAGSTTNVPLRGTGSTDPDGDSITSYAWSGPFGSTTGPTPTVPFQGLGEFGVGLEVNDDFGGASTCNAKVTIIDTTRPSIACNAPATIVPSDAPVSFRATASDVCVGELTAAITDYDCYAFTQQSKRIDKTESCKVVFLGDTLMILDSGGVGDHISWRVSATDSSGNQDSLICQVLVAKKK